MQKFKGIPGLASASLKGLVWPFPHRASLTSRIRGRFGRMFLSLCVSWAGAGFEDWGIAEEQFRGFCNHVNPSQLQKSMVKSRVQ